MGWGLCGVDSDSSHICRLKLGWGPSEVWLEALLGDGEVEGQLTSPAPLGCNTASFKLTHESGVNSSCSLLFIGEQMRDSINSARLTQLTFRLGSHTTPATRLWLGVGAASQLSSVLFAQKCSSFRTYLGCLR